MCRRVSGEEAKVNRTREKLLKYLNMWVKLFWDQFLK